MHCACTCRFELLCRIRIARGFGTLLGRRQLVKQRLLAFNVLLQCSPTAGEFFAVSSQSRLSCYQLCILAAAGCRQHGAGGQPLCSGIALPLFLCVWVSTAVGHAACGWWICEPSRLPGIARTDCALMYPACCCLHTEEYNALYLAEPEFISELVGLVQAEEAVAEEALRTLALRALAAQLHDRSRISSVIAAVTSGGQSGLLSMLLHKSIASILQQADVPLAPSGSGVLPADVAAAAAAAAAAGPSSAALAAAGAGSSAAAAVSTAAAAAPPVGCVQYSVAFVDALLSVVAALVQSSSGYQALNDAGVVAALLPLMRDLHPDHLGLVCTNLRILEAYMDLSQSAATMFRDLGGLTEMIKRLAYEVGVLPPPGQHKAADGLAGRNATDGDVVMASAETSPVQQQLQDSMPAAAASEGTAGAGSAKQVRHWDHPRMPGCYSLGRWSNTWPVVMPSLFLASEGSCCIAGALYRFQQCIAAKLCCVSMLCSCHTTGRRS